MVQQETAGAGQIYQETRILIQLYIFFSKFNGYCPEASLHLPPPGSRASRPHVVEPQDILKLTREADLTICLSVEANRIMI